MPLTRIAKNNALPIELIITNAKTIAAMEEDRIILNRKDKRFRTAQEMFSDLETNNKNQMSDYRCFLTTLGFRDKVSQDVYSIENTALFSLWSVMKT